MRTSVGLKAVILILLLSRKDQSTKVAEDARQQLHQHVLHRAWCRSSVPSSFARFCRKRLLCKL